jgi:hypothetical protein
MSVWHYIIIIIIEAAAAGRNSLKRCWRAHSKKLNALGSYLHSLSVVIPIVFMQREMERSLLGQPSQKYSGKSENSAN